MKNILCNIVNPISPEEIQFLPKQVISIEESKISAITPLSEFQGRIDEDRSNEYALPGFIDLHTHLSQYYIRGLYEPALLPWLNKYVFPEEERSKNIEYAEKLSRDFFSAMLKAGTTTCVIYTAPFFSACDMAFEIAQETGIRALIGMTMMDMNCPENLPQNSHKTLEESILLYEKWHGKNAKLDYIFTPRFAPTCSLELMKEVVKYAIEHNAWIQTHLSENKEEIEMVKEIFGYKSYTEVYQKAGLLTQHSIFAHCIHLNDEEIKMLAENKCKIAHCPDSNFFLKSGEFPLQKIEEAGIEYGLGSDVGAGTSLNMLYHTKMMNYRQSDYPVLPAKALYHITLGSAKLLGVDEIIGSLEIGKEADIVFLKPPLNYPLKNNGISQLVFCGQEFSLTETLVAGRNKE
ncbi:guanine deaminase [Candidatus Cloacimonas acidaminovorans]|jgi:guanine deaminase|uniref:Guanine deaminase n=1 Tax=Cloacimonas acidaminovorans (strain Evry) TaxID=459349 RepID=B0VGA2_CLOAI|nr:guanine deaminase [Candidatus Cloacimonas acidaminovorans]CAO80339.1 putative guanine deaminase [Candidatus Cloacimonas acidaminovorans str. Evry]HNV61519.1 guanine deaminase [Candidatus Cloacimonas acidaminovorans]HPU99811.1 guanine deaminase [Candidatus Cloacimonas acidaminovorans]